MPAGQFDKGARRDSELEQTAGGSSPRKMKRRQSDGSEVSREPAGGNQEDRKS